MTEPSDPHAEAKRLEQLWAGEFGDQYIDRNSNVASGRGPFWREVISEFPIKTSLEVGCSIGANLKWLSELLGPDNVTGVDVNQKALDLVSTKLPGVHTKCTPARSLPFPDKSFDLTFTTGVLIHQPPDELPQVMSEIVRCSRRFVICGEYFSDAPTEVPYRGQERALFKCDFGGMYQSLFPKLQLKKKGFLSKAEGWDDVTYWIFDRSDV
jgi:spore coat polysaccharide biosynthesis protein SpsF